MHIPLIKPDSDINIMFSANTGRKYLFRDSNPNFYFYKPNHKSVVISWTNFWGKSGRLSSLIKICAKSQTFVIESRKYSLRLFAQLMIAGHLPRHHNKRSPCIPAILELFGIFRDDSGSMAWPSYPRKQEDPAYGMTPVLTPLPLQTWLTAQKALLPQLSRLR